MSEADIERGARGVVEIVEQLSATNFGLVCLTPENLEGKWIHFEAGAISNLGKSRVCTVLFQVSHAQIKGPLSDFQYTVFKKIDIKKLLNTLNSKLNKSLPDAILDKQLETYWPELEAAINAIPEIQSHIPERGLQDIAEGILEKVRQLPSQLEKMRSQIVGRGYNPIMGNIEGNPVTLSDLLKLQDAPSGSTHSTAFSNSAKNTGMVVGKIKSAKNTEND